ncbi:MAG: biotin/lipoate A/B protein ligase family protein [Nanoarchaeota archaeon]
MKQKIRLLLTDHNKGSWNMAVDEAVLEAVAAEKQLPTLRLYGWSPSAVTIGYFQSLHEEVDVRICQQKNVDVIRRITGGGAVFHDKEITYSFIIPEDHGLIVKDILQSYKQISEGVIEGLKEFGLTTTFVPINDLIIGQKKVSGNAQTRKQKTILQHGTVLLDVDIRTMFSLLKVSDEKIRDKLITTVEERVTSLKQQLGKEVSFGDAQNALVKGFATALDAEFLISILSSEEQQRAEIIEREKYTAEHWNGMR